MDLEPRAAARQIAYKHLEAGDPLGWFEDLSPNIRADAVRCIASFVAPGGTLLVVARGREPNESEGKMPWPLTKDELSLFKTGGLKEVFFEDYMDSEDPPVRRFRATYRRE